MTCEYFEECRNANNELKCGKCEHNPENWQKMEQEENTNPCYKNPKKFYIFRDNYEPQ